MTIRASCASASATSSTKASTQESAQLGYKVLQQLPKDRNASVYLAYDLYNLGRYDDALLVANKYERGAAEGAQLPVARRSRSQAIATAESRRSTITRRPLQRDPKMVEAYVNRGYVLNDMQDAQQASQDFNTALKLSPNNGIAHLGLAFSDLQLRQPEAGAASRWTKRRS